VTKLEAVLFFIDLITIFTRKTRQCGLFLQMATCVIALFLEHFRLKFNKIQSELRVRPVFLGLRRIDGSCAFLAGFCCDPMAEAMGNPL
jgi:hypothetical protein